MNLPCCVNRNVPEFRGPVAFRHECQGWGPRQKAADRQRGVGWRVEDFKKATEAVVAARREKPALADDNAWVRFVSATNSAWHALYLIDLSFVQVSLQC